MEPANKQRWWWRALGVLIILATLTWFEPNAGRGAVQAVLIPLVIGAAAALVVQNLLAVLAAGALLAGIHADWGNLSIDLATNRVTWPASTAYPIVCISCVLGGGLILLRRFRKKIQATHDARWQQRRSS